VVDVEEKWWKKYIRNGVAGIGVPVALIGFFTLMIYVVELYIVPGGYTWSIVNSLFNLSIILGFILGIIFSIMGIRFSMNNKSNKIGLILNILWLFIYLFLSFLVLTLKNTYVN